MFVHWLYVKFCIAWMYSTALVLVMFMFNFGISSLMSYLPISLAGTLQVKDSCFVISPVRPWINSISVHGLLFIVNSISSFATWALDFMLVFTVRLYPPACSTAYLCSISISSLFSSGMLFVGKPDTTVYNTSISYLPSRIREFRLVP